jgi:hypothetical protein
VACWLRMKGGIDIPLCVLEESNQFAGGYSGKISA